MHCFQSIVSKQDLFWLVQTRPYGVPPLVQSDVASTCYVTSVWVNVILLELVQIHCGLFLVLVKIQSELSIPFGFPTWYMQLLTCGHVKRCGYQQVTTPRTSRHNHLPSSPPLHRRHPHHFHHQTPFCLRFSTCCWACCGLPRPLQVI